jgi:pimeloyl-ACP methyl ester carboxylesterase
MCGVMRSLCRAALATLVLVSFAGAAVSAPAIQVLGRDYEFPNRLQGLPARLSDLSSLQINSFVTSDGVKLAYWEAGEGPPLIFVPGWSGNGAQYINLLALLSSSHHVYVLDLRNQGLSQHVEFGGRIARFSMDLKEFGDHIGVDSADYVGHSMGAAVLWSYIDLFGTKGIRKIAFVDEPLSIYAHDDWSEKERANAGGTTTSPERMVAAFTAGVATNQLVTDLKPFARAQVMDSLYFVNSERFANTFVKNDPKALARVLFNHTVNDWRDVVARKIDVPTAIFSGEESNNLPSQRWAQSVIRGASLFAYTAAEQGDHFLMFKNPVRFVRDFREFLAQ